MNQENGNTEQNNITDRPAAPANKVKSKTASGHLKKLALVIFTIFGLYFILDFLVMPIYTRHWQRVQVGDVLNMSFVAAQKILNGAGLKVVKAEEKYDENNPPGFVLFQNPEAGSFVKKGRRIYLTTGKGLRIITMPKLVGMAERDAQFTLQEHNLTIGKVSYGMDSFYPEGVVIGQSKTAGEDVTIGESIDMVVSLGVELSNFIVPDLVGKSLAEAKAALHRAGLEVGDIRYEIFDKLLPNTVIEQSIFPGAQAQAGEVIDLIISRLAGQDKEE